MSPPKRIRLDADPVKDAVAQEGDGGAGGGRSGDAAEGGDDADAEIAAMSKGGDAALSKGGDAARQGGDAVLPEITLVAPSPVRALANAPSPVRDVTAPSPLRALDNAHESTATATATAEEDPVIRRRPIASRPPGEGRPPTRSTSDLSIVAAFKAAATVRAWTVACARSLSTPTALTRAPHSGARLLTAERGQGGGRGTPVAQGRRRPRRRAVDPQRLRQHHGCAGDAPAIAVRVDAGARAHADTNADAMAQCRGVPGE